MGFRDLGFRVPCRLLLHSQHGRLSLDRIFCVPGERERDARSLKLEPIACTRQVFTADGEAAESSAGRIAKMHEVLPSLQATTVLPSLQATTVAACTQRNGAWRRL